MLSLFVFPPSQLYRSDSDSSTLPKKSPFIRNTLERRTLRYKQVGMTMLLCYTHFIICCSGSVLMCPFHVTTAVSPLLSGWAAHTYLSGPGAGPPGLPYTTEAAERGAGRTAGAQTTAGGAHAGPPRPRGPPSLGPAGWAFPKPATWGPETGTAHLYVFSAASLPKFTDFNTLANINALGMSYFYSIH